MVGVHFVSVRPDYLVMQHHTGATPKGRFAIDENPPYRAGPAVGQVGRMPDTRYTGRHAARAWLAAHGSGVGMFKTTTVVPIFE